MPFRPGGLQTVQQQARYATITRRTVVLPVSLLHSMKTGTTWQDASGFVSQPVAGELPRKYELVTEAA